jgi:hypothetical protein
MKKFRKLIIIFLIFGILIMTALIFLPSFLESTIKKQVTKASAEYVNADVSFDDFSLSLFSHFPELTVELSDLQVIGKGKFKGQPLVKMDEFQLVLNFLSVLGDNPEIKSIYLKDPQVFIKVLKDGSANYDIYIEQPVEKQDKVKAESSLQLALNRWVIENANISYDDASMDFMMKIKNMQHEGSGELASDVFDLLTETEIESMLVDFEGTKYIDKKRLEMDMTLAMDMAKMKFVFKENKVQLNDFALSFEGFFEMPKDGYNMDIEFAAPTSEFKSLLSLIPPEFLPQDVETNGKFSFNGKLKGMYNEVKNTLPGFDIQFKINEAMLKYPDLPTPVKNINIDMQVLNETGDLDQTLIDVRSFDMNLGQNPVHGKVKIKGLEEYQIDADINTKMNLADVAGFYPLDSAGLKELKGDFEMKILAKGVYSETKNTIPTIDAVINLKDGYVHPLEYDLAMENITVNAKAENTSGKMADLKVDFSDISFSMDGQPFTVQGHFFNLDNINYDFKAKGELDLEKITQIFPLEDMSLRGIIDADVQTQGKMSSIETEQYEELATSGDFKVKNFQYTSSDLPQGMRIRNANLTFSPRVMELKSFDGDLGKSDMQLTGKLTNYLAYGLSMAGMKEGKQTLHGNMVLKSKKFDLNEWMTDVDTVQTEEGEAYGIVEVPKGIDFTFDADITEVLYEDMILSNTKGMIVIRNGVVRMNDLTFETAGGAFGMSGSYDTQDITNPLFDFDFKIADMQIGKAAQQFSTIKAFAPIAEQMEGLFNTNFKIKGGLGNDLMPKFETLSGSGLVTVKEALFNQDNKLMQKLTEFTSLKALPDSKLKDIILVTQIKDGKMQIEPVDVKIGDYQFNIGGTTAFDGALDFKIKVDAPKEDVSGKLQEWFNLKPDVISNENIELFLQIGGKYNSPKIGLDQEKTKEYVKTQLKSSAKKKATGFLQGLIDKNKDKIYGEDEQDSTNVESETDSTQTDTGGEK